MNTINGIPIVWDTEGDNNLFGSLFLQGNNLGSNKPFNEISNERALQTPFGKNSMFYTAKQGTLTHFLSESNQLEAFKKLFPNIDLEKIQLSGDLKEITPQEEPYFCKTQKLQIVQHNIGDSFENYFKNFVDISTNQLKTYLDNFTWFLEGNQSNCITFHLFATENHIKEIVCTIGSDIFDCLKVTTRVNATGGFTIADKNGKYQVNPELKDFKNHLLTWLKKTYSDSNTIKPVFYLNDDKIETSIDNEFKAEGDYQKTVDFIFEKIGVTTAFKNLLNDCKDASKKVKSYRIDENQYLPFLPNFDPIFNDTLLKAFGVNPNVKIEDYFADFEREDIKKFQLQEKEVNWVFGFNAAFCGLWNALVDTADGFVGIIPSLYEVFTDRGAFKVFLHFIKEFFEHITELMGKIEEWELKNASYSVYRHEYTECYAISLLVTLFIPIPKTAIGERIGAAIVNSSTKAFETVNELTQSLLRFLKAETLEWAYKMGLRVEKTAENYVLVFDNLVLIAGNQQEIALRIEKITQTGLLPLRDALGLKNIHLYVVNNLIIRFKLNTKTIDLVEYNGELFFRLATEEFSNFIEFFKLEATQRHMKIMEVTNILRLTSKAKYNPATAKAKGFDVPVSKNGISADFAKTPYLYNGKSIVKIRMTGSRSKDFELAYKKMRMTDKKLIEKIDEEFVWHHLDDMNENLECTMQLVTKEAHKATLTHIGSCGQSEKVLNTKYKP